MCTPKGLIEHIDACDLARKGLPQPRNSERLVFTGEVEGWTRTAGEAYIRALGITLPAGQINCHRVFVHQLADKTCLHVPALALIRGLFRPHRLLLPALFYPGSIDALGFVDFSTIPPQVVLDSCPHKYGKAADGDSLREPLRWAHTSHSGRRCALSIQAFSNGGSIDLVLPKGTFRLVMHGHRLGDNFFVTKVTVISIVLPAHDSISGADEAFTLHRMASKDRKVTALSDLPAIPLRQDKRVNLTEAEWKRIEKLLPCRRTGCYRYSRRLLLDLILEKLACKDTWEVMAKRSGVPEVSLTTTFRRWDLDGRFAKVLEALTQMRDESGLAAAQKSERLKANYKMRVDSGIGLARYSAVGVELQAKTLLKVERCSNIIKFNKNHGFS